MVLNDKDIPHPPPEKLPSTYLAYTLRLGSTLRCVEYMIEGIIVFDI